MYPRTIRKTGLQGEATPKQVEYAEAIAELLGVGMPTVRTKQTMSDFISEHAVRYKQTVAEMKLQYETDMEMIDARRDW